jgi:hypothetical protein
MLLAKSGVEFPVAGTQGAYALPDELRTVVFNDVRAYLSALGLELSFDPAVQQ